MSVKLFIDVPTADSAGYLRRMIQVRDILNEFSEVDELEQIEQIDAMIKMAHFLKDYVRVEPATEDKLEVLYDLSMNEFMSIMNHFQELANPPKKNTSPTLASGSQKPQIVRR
jgi:hypothetical protein